MFLTLFLFCVVINIYVVNIFKKYLVTSEQQESGEEEVHTLAKTWQLWEKLEDEESKRVGSQQRKIIKGVGKRF